LPTTSGGIALVDCGYPERKDVEAVVQRNLQAIGIKLDIQNYPADTFFGSFLPGGKASPPTGAVAGRYDPNDSGILACGDNSTFYCNPALDALYKQELATADAGARQDIFHQIHQIYLTELPFIVLYSTSGISIVHKGTHNFQQSPFEGPINIWQWWCDGGKC